MQDHDILQQYYGIDALPTHPVFEYHGQFYLWAMWTKKEQELDQWLNTYYQMMGYVYKHGFQIVLNCYHQKISYQHILFLITPEPFALEDFYRLQMLTMRRGRLDLKKEVEKMVNQVDRIRCIYAKQLNYLDAEEEKQYILAMYYLGIAENCISLVHQLDDFCTHLLIRESIGHKDLTAFDYVSFFNPFNFFYGSLAHDIACLYKYQKIDLQECINGMNYMHLSLVEMVYLFILVVYPFEFFKDIEIKVEQKKEIKDYFEFLPLEQKRMKDLYRYIAPMMPIKPIEWLLK